MCICKCLHSYWDSSKEALSGCVFSSPLLVGGSAFLSVCRAEQYTIWLSMWMNYCAQSLRGVLRCRRKLEKQFACFFFNTVHTYDWRLFSSWKENRKVVRYLALGPVCVCVWGRKVALKSATQIQKKMSSAAHCSHFYEIFLLRIFCCRNADWKVHSQCKWRYKNQAGTSSIAWNIPSVLTLQSCVCSHVRSGSVRWRYLRALLRKEKSGGGLKVKCLRVLVKLNNPQDIIQ